MRRPVAAGVFLLLCLGGSLLGVASAAAQLLVTAELLGRPVAALGPSFRWLAVDYSFVTQGLLLVTFGLPLLAAGYYARAFRLPRQLETRLAPYPAGFGPTAVLLGMLGTLISLAIGLPQVADAGVDLGSALGLMLMSFKTSVFSSVAGLLAHLLVRPLAATFRFAIADVLPPPSSIQEAAERQRDAFAQSTEALAVFTTAIGELTQAIGGLRAELAAEAADKAAINATLKQWVAGLTEIISLSKTFVKTADGRAASCQVVLERGLAALERRFDIVSEIACAAGERDRRIALALAQSLAAVDRPPPSAASLNGSLPASRSTGH